MLRTDLIKQKSKIKYFKKVNPISQMIIDVIYNKGKTQKQIAQELNLSDRTIRKYLKLIPDVLDKPYRLYSEILGTRRHKYYVISEVKQWKKTQQK